MAHQPCRAALAAGRLTARLPQRRPLTTSQQDPLADAIRSSRRHEAPVIETPRWAQTPERMKAPLQLDFAKDPRNKIWAVNNDPARLDEMYKRLLGPGGHRMLPEELKWLAVTHKSFDQGRRGFNDRLAMMGRMALIMEATSHIINQEPYPKTNFPDPYDRKPFTHPRLASVDNLAIEGPRHLVGKEKLFELALAVNMGSAIRWKPRMVHRLKESGIEVVFSAAIMAIVGAIHLQHGAAVSSDIIRDRIILKIPDSKLEPLSSGPPSSP
ncbi:hypothetical protein GQ602_001591 [Ophiocordyceps camponoti-floridani]|uniref:RNase III domain-containing protein n=1 Tax=Ophiocordyceps camponoti-floridani TaxID=2030778 RepID=A0A8H4VHG9_9HYPO|nr:hypothetical protein GQ602_001591 [Ophiocordyceps camponoti-floridani]